jgi:uncharacterized membrane protein
VATAEGEHVNGRPRLRWVRRRLVEAVQDNQWLLPALGGAAGTLLAVIVGNGDSSTSWMVTVDRSRDTMIAALGLTFTALSIVLALASVAAQSVVSRFGSRTLRMYLRRSSDRWVISSFSFTAAFILTEQFQLRSLAPDAPAPVAGIAISTVLIVFTSGLVIWYIASVTRWFRVDQAVAGVIAAERRALRAAVRLRQGTVEVSIPDRPEGAADLIAPRSGHLAEFDTDSMLDDARELDAVVVITRPLGSPVVEGDRVGWYEARGSSPSDEIVAERIDITLGRELSKSVDYGLYALVDIAIMALSPAVNDPNSAVQVIEEMSFLFADLAKLPLGPYAVPDTESCPRVVVAARTFGELVELATTQIVLYGITDPNVARALGRFAESLDRLDLSDADRRHVDDFVASLTPSDPTT